ncbi:hypothetical protein [Streptomyces sp. SYSU K217416]
MLSPTRSRTTRRPAFALIAEHIAPQYRLAVYVQSGTGQRTSEALAFSTECRRPGFVRIRWQVSAKAHRDDCCTAFVPLKHRAEGEYRDVPAAPFVEQEIDDHLSRWEPVSRGGRVWGVLPSCKLRSPILSRLLVAGELSLLGEFPEASHSRAVLEAVGSGERTFSAIAAQAGGAGALPSGTLSPLLARLQAKRVLAADLPLPAKPDSKNKRYRIADPYLRFWLAFLARAIPLIERGRGDLALERIERSWATWRGRAVEPLIRESLLRLMPNDE